MSRRLTDRLFGPAFGISRKLIAVNGLIEQPGLHCPGCHPFHDLSDPGGFPSVIDCRLRDLFAPSPKKCLLPFHLVLPRGPAAVSGSGRLREYYQIALPRYLDPSHAAMTIFLKRALL